nr:hypothetical protein GCM10020063_009590 [Dactylosporangium thailandense]
MSAISLISNILEPKGMNAAAAWQQAEFCAQCGASFVPGDRRMVETDRVLGQALLRRAEADRAHRQRSLAG